MGDFCLIVVGLKVGRQELICSFLYYIEWNELETHSIQVVCRFDCFLSTLVKLCLNARARAPLNFLCWVVHTENHRRCGVRAQSRRADLFILNFPLPLPVFPVYTCQSVDLIYDTLFSEMSVDLDTDTHTHTHSCFPFFIPIDGWNNNVSDIWKEKRNLDKIIRN
jgi:hypothetical protein